MSDDIEGRQDQLAPHKTSAGDLAERAGRVIPNNLQV